VTFTSSAASVTVSGAGVSVAAPATNFTGAAARSHEGGAAQGGAWSFIDYGSLDSRLVVQQSGWYELRVQGVGTIADLAGPLVHVRLNRTVVAEGVQGTTIDLSARHYLVAGVGYTLGASFENPWPGRTARFDRVSATPSTAPADLPPPAHVDAVNDPAGWPQYGRDGYNTRSNDDPSLPTVATAASLSLGWRAALDGSVTSTPTVVDGRVFVGTWAKSLYALNETTGAVLWRVGLPNAVDGSIAVAQGKVVVSDVQTVMAFNASTGAPLWTSFNFGGHAWSSPTIDGDGVFLGLGTGRGYVVRFALATGAVVWSTPTAEDPNGGARVWASPLVPPGSGLVVVGTSPGDFGGQGPTIDSLMALDRETGVVRWVHQFFPRDLNRDTSPEAERENRDFSGTPHLAFLNGRPVVLATEKHGPGWMVDLTDGSLVSGSRELESRPGHIGSGGVSDGVRVVSSAGTDSIAAFDVATGDLLWEHLMPSTEFAPVAIGNGVVWIGSWEGHLQGFDLHTGRALVQLDAGGGILGGASLADGKVFVGSLQRTPTMVDFGDSLGKLPGLVSAWGH
jgi:outer membrane protein assembly factor BamB